MNLIVRIPDKHAASVSAADPARLERVALEAVLQAVTAGTGDEPAMAGIAPDAPSRTPAEAAARIRASRVGNTLPDGVSIRDLMTHGRA
jgi:hypothetical protein